MNVCGKNVLVCYCFLSLVVSSLAFAHEPLIGKVCNFVQHTFFVCKKVFFYHCCCLLTLGNFLNIFIIKNWSICIYS